MQLITYAGEPVAVVVDRDLAVFDPALEVRGLDDPLLRFAGAICQLAMELELGIAQGPCDEKRAEGYARELLMPAGEFSALAWLPDAYLATCFGVPALHPERRDKPASA